MGAARIHFVLRFTWERSVFVHPEFHDLGFFGNDSSVEGEWGGSVSIQNSIKFGIFSNNSKHRFISLSLLDTDSLLLSTVDIEYQAALYRGTLKPRRNEWRQGVGGGFASSHACNA
ncbi:hypothetical protein Q31a_18300 [Aureliella helgolandensis]|uniref:Uncharacterized protein n=1 Tax=Aureliella helgolandensis TaxID=2527968 RepID=A0A518G4R1_9BACT|nr:hypothetical protein Q31a_18300 [Aureliella helgolandensis]